MLLSSGRSSTAWRQKQVRMLIGLTGAMGAGKSSVARLFADWGAVSIDADRVAHQVLARVEVISQLREAFGDEVLLRDGTLNRRELGRRAFANESGWRSLTQIVRPPLTAQLWKEIEKAISAGSEMVVVDAPLLYEWGMDKHVDVVVVVDAGVELCKERIQMRSGISDTEIGQRMAYQLSAAEKKELADFLIDNNGTVDNLHRQAQAVWFLLKRRLEV